MRKTKRLGESNWQAMIAMSRPDTFGVGIGIRAVKAVTRRAEYKVCVSFLGFLFVVGVELTRDALAKEYGL